MYTRILRFSLHSLAGATLLLAACGQPAQQPPAAGSQPTPGAQQPAGAGGNVIFFSNQFWPLEEQAKMRDVILKDSPVQAEYIAEEPGPFNDRLNAETRAGKVTVSLVGGLHGDLESFVRGGYIEDITPLAQKLSDRGIAAGFTELSRMGTPDKTYYIPWMQATYVLAVNKKALEHLPQGADVNALTYQQLEDWGANMQKATGKRLLGFPAGPNGLLQRLFQGYLYPSFTGSAGVVGFRSPEAVTMWSEFKEMWQYVNPQSTSYEFMQEPLLSEEVWVAWDHVARLVKAPNERPNDFILVPAPAGPKGRGFMPVLAGLAIPKGAPNRAGAEQIIEYLTQPKQQTNTAAQLAFFPVTSAPVPTDASAGIKLEAEAVQKQTSAKDGLPALVPIGLGAKSGDFKALYMDTFQRIVIRNEDIQSALDAQAKTLQAIMDESGAKCWAPDPPSDGPCQVK
jgi:multiple sugar transport system substrate-binding protein